MPKLSQSEVTKQQIEDYVSSDSDFGFELEILRALRSLKIDCEHGGHYDDPVTGKLREFDIRAHVSSKIRSVRFAIECKNIRKNFPLLISCVPRVKDEAFHECMYADDDLPKAINGNLPLIGDRAIPVRLTGSDSLYDTDAMVGKSTNQIGFSEHDGSLISNDASLYDKWAQSLASMSDLVDRAYLDGAYDGAGPHISTLVPLLVVPDQTLWAVHYDSDGKLIHGPALQDHCSCFVGRQYRAGDKLGGVNLFVSHIEVLTQSGLIEFLKQRVLSEVAINALMPQEKVHQAVSDYIAHR